MNTLADPVYDIAIIGAGAAGLMAAVFCAEGPRRVLLLEGKEKPASKILISGGGRCNVGRRSVTEKDYSSGHPRTVRNILRTFSAERTAEFFKTLGVDLVEEEDGKLFPRTQRAQTVREALLRETEGRGVELQIAHKVTAVRHREERFQVFGEKFKYESRAVILCTGGLSYPETGSDGSGYRLAGMFGHMITETTPALTPLLCDDSDWLGLAGIAVPCRLTVRGSGKNTSVSEGALLFTHTGFSGPCALDISRHWIRAKGSLGPDLTADFMPDFTEQECRNILKRAVETAPGHTVKGALSEKLPDRLIRFLFSKISLPEKTVFNQLKRADRENLIGILYRCPLPVKGIAGYDKAEATAGGVSLGEVDSRTLESKLCRGLFFAGEILDVDGRLGGFNFQWAWSSAAAAASGAGKFLAL